MAKKVITPATVENVTPATVEAPASAPATVEAPATEKKINLKKEVKEMNKTAKTPATVETAPVTAPVAPVKAIKETDPVTANPALDVEAEKKRITEAISLHTICQACYDDINQEGERINPTNWGKNETTNGNPTIGGYVRKRWAECQDKIDSLKRELKCLYFTLDPVLVALQENASKAVKDLVNACIEDMRNVIILQDVDFYDIVEQGKSPRVREDINETLQALASAGVERLGVAVELLGNAIPVLGAYGYVLDLTATQPVTIEGKNIEGLDPVPARVYYSFKKA